MRISREARTKIIALAVGAAFMAAGFVYYLSLRSTRENSKAAPDDKGSYTAVSADYEAIEAHTAVSYPIDINKATFSDLTSVKGIGKVTADDLLAYRERVGKITDMAQLLEIDGIGEETACVMEKYFYVSDKDFSKLTTTTKASSVKKTSKASKAGTKKTTTTTTAAAEKTTATTRQVSFPIDINKVTTDELMMINGIGQVTAENIIAYRERTGKITDMQQLLEIGGIGDATYQLLCEYLYVAEGDYSPITTTTESKTQTTVSSPTAASSSKTTTTAAGTTTGKETSVSSSETTSARVQRMVNINTADAGELSDALLIDNETAQLIVDFRERIGKYQNIIELLNIEVLDKRFTDELYNSIKDYICV